jgi:hypothetical protein
MSDSTLLGHDHTNSGEMTTSVDFVHSLPPNYALSLCTDTNSTRSSIPGPGRLVGSLLSSAGRRVEVAIDRFAERRLGLGPTVAALKIAAELHDGHVQIHHSARLTQSDRLMNWPEFLDGHIDMIALEQTLIRICNGICPACRDPYVPYTLSTVSDTMRKNLQQLLSYIG